MQKILVVAVSSDLVSLLTQSLSCDYALTFCHSDKEARHIPLQDYDALILDLFLPGADGLALLEDLRDTLPPVVLVLSSMVSPYILQAVQGFGGGYVLPLPSSDTMIQARLADMLRKAESAGSIFPVHTAQYHLRRLNICTSRNGYRHLKAILSVYDVSRNYSLSKDFYAPLAKENAVTVDAIDNAIHTVILKAYETRDDAIWRAYFPDTSRCPRNKVFISAVAERMK